METLTSWLYPQRSDTIFTQLHKLKFFVGNDEHLVKPLEVPPHTTLNMYLRQNAHLTGTKNMCLEGGCGACVVAVTIMDPVTNREETLAVNSCLVPIYSCSGWKIHTIESIGDPKTGYHPVQKAMVQFNGTECGFCSPGMIMNMYALYQSGKITMKEVENSFGGNICRCTGYRPILSAFKSLATDASSDILGTYTDIEDIPICTKTQGKCQQKCAKRLQAHCYEFGESRWVKVSSINEVLDTIIGANDGTYMLVGGNTATGVYKRTKEPDVYIDITSVKDLLDHTITDQSLILGANMTLTKAMVLFSSLGKENPKFAYLQKLADHIDLIGNVPVRNIGTLAGNLFTKHEHQEFPSDIFLILETAGASLTIINTDRKETAHTLTEFLSLDMKGKIIKHIALPILDETYKYESYKIMPRAQNAHALVNAGFLLQLDDSSTVKSVRIVYGAINPEFVHATKAEEYLVGKSIFNDDTLQMLFRELDSEILPDHVLPDPSPAFRKKLAIALFYKFVLSIAPDGKLSPRNVSGGKKQTRPVSFGTQEYGTNKSMYPVTQPISKIEALAQCTGAAQYIMDIPDQPGQLYAAFVLAKAPASSVISNIDVSDALKLEGVVAFYDKNGIPGRNTFTPKELEFSHEEELFCSGVVKFYFQPIGIIVATNQELAEKAADMVQISYVAGKRKPLVTAREILKAKATDKIFLSKQYPAKSKGTDIKHVINGSFDIYWQYHYHMETQCCVVIPVEDGLDMYPSTQYVKLAKGAAAAALNMPMNRINVFVRRVGGAFGAKITRNSLISTAAAIAAYKLQKPVKLWMPLTTNMNAIGKRNPLSMDYEVGVNDKGVIQYMKTSLYTDIGAAGENDNEVGGLYRNFGKIYNKDTWAVDTYYTKTDTQSATACRAPGTTEATSSAESIMQHIATALNLDPIEVRLANLNNQQELIKYINELKQWADVEKRRMGIETFNKVNRWVKRGLSVVPMTYNIAPGAYYNVLVSIYGVDGTVAIVHGGIEMGQGINTKVTQTCAYALGIGLDQISIKPTNDVVSPNSGNSGGSLTSESVCYATLKACDILKERMKPVKDKMNNPSWLELVQKCTDEGIDLSACSLLGNHDLDQYTVYGAACVEVEVDILTGVYKFTRVDILEDAGDSISPKIDIGQVEGGFIMGLGYWTTEKLVYNEEGELLTNRTWNYKPPGAKDIPIDFRVKFPKDNPNKFGVLHSKATAEPPMCMTCAGPFAIRNAVASARAEADGSADKWYPIDGPSTVEDTFLNSLHDYKQYTL